MKTIAAVLAIAMILASASLIYPATMEIIRLDEDADEVYMMTATGHVYVMDGVEDWEEGDLVSLLMFSNDTPAIEDDIIISARWSGYNIKY